MYPGSHALTNPDRPALIMTATGEIVTYAELENRSRRAASWLFDAGGMNRSPRQCPVVCMPLNLVNTTQRHAAPQYAQ